MSSWLFVEQGPNPGGSFNLRQMVLTIGRSPVNLVQINHKSVSRRHAQLRQSDDTYMVQDLKSANGTFVNGKRIEAPTRLDHDDILQVGEVVLRYKLKTIQGNLTDLVMGRKDASRDAKVIETVIHEMDPELLNSLKDPDASS